MIFFRPERLGDFFVVPRGWVIFFCLERLGDFFCPERLGYFFCPERLGDFFSCPGRLGDFFFVWRGLVICFPLFLCYFVP